MASRFTLLRPSSSCSCQSLSICLIFYCFLFVKLNYDIQVYSFKPSYSCNCRTLSIMLLFIWLLVHSARIVSTVCYLMRESHLWIYVQLTSLCKRMPTFSISIIYYSYRFTRSKSKRCPCQKDLCHDVLRSWNKDTPKIWHNSLGCLSFISARATTPEYSSSGYLLLRLCLCVPLCFLWYSIQISWILSRVTLEPS